MEWFDTHFIFWIALSFFFNGLVAHLWHKKFYLKLGLKQYKAIQRIHLNETPRLGGLIFIICLAGYAWTSSASESTDLLKVILLSLMPAMIVALKEDLLQNVEPAIRLLSLLFAGWIFKASYVGHLPDLNNIPLISSLLVIHGSTSLFYIFGMVAIANGMNMIDGVNGLCAAVALSILSALLFLAYKTGDVTMLPIIFGVMLLAISFLIINYPYGRIFLGDLGAYSLGLIVSILTIILFGRHPDLNVWGAVLILIYPLTEITFSMLRRMAKGISIYHPDRNHLHLKLFYFFRPQLAYKRIANALVTPLLSGLWLFPLIATSWTYHKFIFIFIAIILFVLIYVLLYNIIPNAKKTK